MVRKELTFYCVICLQVITSRKYSSLARFVHHAVVFVMRPDLHRPQRICGPCEQQLVHPYEIVLNTNGDVARLIHTTSRLLAAKCAKNSVEKPRALIALDPIPCRAYLPYPGKLATGAAYAHFKAHLGGKELSHEYATEGPRLDDGATPTVLIGQYARRAARSCAHYVNCAKGLGVPANCTWGYKKVDSRFRATYPDLDPLVMTPRALGAAYPGLRVASKRGIRPGEELLLDGYGPDFWKRMEHEAAGDVNVIRPGALGPNLLCLLDDDDAELPQRRGMKRAREF
jgi:hypothetical protein